MTELYVRGLGLFTPEYPTVDAWREGARAQSPVLPSGASLDRRSRRISSRLMRGFAEAYQEALIASGFDAAMVASVFGSSLGEVDTMIRLLDQMWDLREEPSPMAFAASVHNAAAGVVSISNKNQAFTTSIAADFDTVAMALVEAVGLAITGEGGGDVIVACGDEPAPEKLVDEGVHWSFVCGAIALSAEPGDAPLARIQLPVLGPEATVQPPTRAKLEDANPQAGLWNLIDAVIHKRWGRVALDHGRGRGWVVEVSAP